MIKIDQRNLASLSEQRLHIKWQQKALTKLLGLQYTIVYKQGVENGAADALSRQPHTDASILLELHAMSSAQPAWLTDILHSYSQDSFCTDLLQKLSTSPTAGGKFSLKAGVLRVGKCIWVGSDLSL